MGVLSGKTIVLGVSGGIAAYKSAELVRLLVTAGANVRVMMTRNATEFITPLTLQTLSANPVATDTFSLTQESEIGHIRLADSADAIVIAPATADVIAKAAVGIADDIVTTVLLATRAKVAFAPAMNVHMYEHPTVAENLAKLRVARRGDYRAGRGRARVRLRGQGAAAGPGDHRRGNREDALAAGSRGREYPGDGGTDAASRSIRCDSSRTDRRARWALRSRARHGAAVRQVRIVAGPSALATPYGVERIDTVTASAMLAQDHQQFSVVHGAGDGGGGCGFPSRESGARQDQEGRPRASTRDGIDCRRDAALAAKKGARLLIGFAAETDDLEANARAKLKRKGLDLIVANDVTREGAGFEVDTNIVTLIGADGRSQSHPQMSKDAVADLILDRIVALRAAKPKSGRAEKSSRLRAVR